MFEKGQIVFSKKGRDKRRAFIVVNVEGEFVWLVDGDLRKFDKPKKKKEMHIQITNNVASEIQALLESGKATDSDFRKALVPYKLLYSK